ncbi:MAG TPA: chemotaxis protein CheA [Chthonomonadaceae bacterium]|nr:chemotaxis protein CheA [Chthonomonadaceae bacterium]
MNEDMKEYLGVFLDEANEQMDLLEQDILVLEQSPSQELLQEIFRAAHTLKGSSRAMGFTAMGELTHAMEDVFDKLRHEELTVNGELINALFAGLDALKAMKEEIAASGTTTYDTFTQTARLRAALEGQPVAPTAEPASAAEPAEQPDAFQTVLSDNQQMAVQEAVENHCTIYGLTIQIASDCVMKSVRALMVLQALETVGSILATTPDDEALENENFDFEFEVVVATQNDVETLQAAVNRVNEIVEVRVTPWQERSGESPLPAPLKARVAEAPKASVEEPTPRAKDERVADAGPEARGKAPEDVQKLAADKKATTQTQTVRVDVSRLDKLLNLVGELVIDRTRIAELGGQFERQFGSHGLVENLSETAAHIGRITEELQEEIMKARMLPIDNVFNRFPRMIRDLAQKLNKEINFVIEGKETELDRSVIEVIGDPLIHMLRNSVDHGIETPEDREKAGKPRTGTVWLRARHQENHIVIEIADDGKGISPEALRANAVKKGILTQEAAQRLTDREAIHLIFASGFSTAQVVTDVSGRGVGMDIVRSNLQKLGATVEIDSQVGKGSTFTVKLPLTLAIIRGLLVSVRSCVYALPLNTVVETLKISEDVVHVVNHREVILQRGKMLPIVRLQDVFLLDTAVTPAERNLDRIRGGAESPSAQMEPASAEMTTGQEAVTSRRARSASPSLYLVIVGMGEQQVGLVVDTLVGEQEVVIKTLGKFIGDIRGISGATILGDGRVALIVDVSGIIHIASEEKGRAYAS